jgi:glycosyltransferase involved in cell wall biosynthesis
MFSIIITFYITQLIIAIVLWYGNLKTKSFTSLDKILATTVIIPFKNEADRVSPLIRSINRAAILNKKTNLFAHLQFIFIDDHSSDESTNMILNNLDISYQIIRLRNTSGKKNAIKKGVEEAIYDRVLTLDADVNFSEYYLETISKTPCLGLTILPVNMDSKNICTRINAVEFWFLQRLTFGLAGLNKYLLCNGANLLFTREAFKKAIEIRKDSDIPSGDDIFFLKAAIQLKIPVQAINNKLYSVITEPPLKLTELVNQRKRWILKSKNISSLIGGLFIILSNIFFIICLYLIWDEGALFLIPIGLKVLSEIISVDGFEKKMITFLHQFSYPIYLLLLLFNIIKSTQKTTRWREIKD